MLRNSLLIARIRKRSARRMSRRGSSPATLASRVIARGIIPFAAAKLHRAEVTFVRSDSRSGGPARERRESEYRLLGGVISLDARTGGCRRGTGAAGCGARARASERGDLRIPPLFQLLPCLICANFVQYVAPLRRLDIHPYSLPASLRSPLPLPTPSTLGVILEWIKWK